MNNQNKANAAVKFSNSHLLRIESQIHGDVKVKKKLTIYEQRNAHCVKSVQIRIQEYRNIRTRNNHLFGHFLRSDKNIFSL